MSASLLHLSRESVADPARWYLNTLAAAEQLYDALYVWKKQASITVTPISLAFFRDFSSSIAAGTYAAGSPQYTTLYAAIAAYADGFVSKVQQYAQNNGSLAEQYDRNNGNPLSARDLTWSYASFLTAAARRAGVLPPAWAGANPAATSLPSSCYATSIVGSYSAVSVPSFPPSQTPISGVPPTTTGTGPAPTTTRVGTPTTTTSCATATAVAVTFNSRKVTQFGQTVKIVGNNAALGNWDTGKAVTLSASGYSANNPVWSGTVTLAAGQALQYKYIVVNQDGSVTWEADPNRAYTVPRSCSTTASRSDTWQ